MKNTIIVLLLFYNAIIFGQDNFGDLFKRDPNKQMTFRQHSREGNKQLKRGDFSLAAFHSMSALLVKSDFKNAAETFEKSMPNANIHVNRIITGLNRRIEISKDPDTTIRIMNDLIDRLYKANELNNNLVFVRSSKFKTMKNPNGYFEDFNLRYEEAISAKQAYLVEVSEDIYQKALVVAATQERENYKKAYEMIRSISKYVDNYKDSRELATLYLDTYNEMTAEMYYTEGKKLFDNAKTKMDYQKAFFTFRKTRDYVIDYKDVDELVAKSQDLGTYKIVYLAFFGPDSEKVSSIYNKLLDPKLYKTNSSSANLNNIDNWLKVIRYDVNHGGEVKTLEYIKNNAVFENVDYFVKFSMSDFKAEAFKDDVSLEKGKVKIPTTIKDVYRNQSLDLYLVNGLANCAGQLEFININDINGDRISLSLDKKIEEERNIWMTEKNIRFRDDQMPAIKAFERETNAKYVISIETFLDDYKKQLLYNIENELITNVKDFVINSFEVANP